MRGRQPGRGALAREVLIRLLGAGLDARALHSSAQVSTLLVHVFELCARGDMELAMQLAQAQAPQSALEQSQKVNTPASRSHHVCLIPPPG